MLFSINTPDLLCELFIIIVITLMLDSPSECYSAPLLPPSPGDEGGGREDAPRGPSYCGEALEGKLWAGVPHQSLLLTP